MSWLYLVISGCFEIFGVGSIKLFTTKKDLRSLLILILAFSGSFLFLYLGMRQLPMGVSYAVWTGIGTAGGAILGMLLGESKDPRQIFFIFLIIVSVIGLKLIC